MYAGRRPDFAWWRKALGQPPLWPGAQVRRIGFCAEQASMLWRTFCIETAAAKIPFTLFGDPGWKRLLAADADLRPRVDYYHSLPSVYGQAAYTLNTTSLLLPRGLTQRHFDVWAAGGFLITDQTRGLGIFPEKLISPVCFSHPGQIPRLVRRFDKEPGLKADLAGAWRRLILLRHTYENRVAHIIHRVLNT